MLQVRPRDLLALHEEGRYYYFVVLTKQVMLGGQLVFAINLVSSKPLPAAEVLQARPIDGFHCIIDFIAAKRSDSIVRLASNIDVTDFDGVTYLRQNSPNFGHDKTWAIWDRDGKLVSRPSTLTAEQMSYPVFVCSLHHEACQRIDSMQQHAGV